ncbi:hypothetical protein HPB50_003787 [Hyalomma asiaticum]|uniref:Uncharacterized protein n=1 Tax=Hyalomma asiaticum TaxID=266040 RepID=A0ACB7S6S5_HYAAI|nr:hypothetical protein HPB50_003787 [Hyalomma asiaticum]
MRRGLSLGEPSMNKKHHHVNESPGLSSVDIEPAELLEQLDLPMYHLAAGVLLRHKHIPEIIASPGELCAFAGRLQGDRLPNIGATGGRFREADRGTSCSRDGLWERVSPSVF